MLTPFFRHGHELAKYLGHISSYEKKHEVVELCSTDGNQTIVEIHINQARHGKLVSSLGSHERDAFSRYSANGHILNIIRRPYLEALPLPDFV